MLSDLQKRLDSYNQEQGDVCAKMARTDEGQLVIAICTPLMKRVHAKVRQSGEMLFIDSTGNCDCQNHRLFLLLTHSSVGGLPLGVLITTSESQPTITAALQLFSTILPEDGFYGRQEKGPQVIMTDDCLALRNSLRAIYSDATLILCAFHLAQATWRWLWSSHHGLLKGHRSQLMRSFQLLVYADTPSSLAENYRMLIEDPVAKGHPEFIKHLADVYGRREEWAICLQSGLPTRGHHTNNYAQSAMRVLKDKVLYRLKAYNITQLVDFVHTRLEAHYIRRLTDVANNQVRGEERTAGAVDCGAIVKEDEMNYIVPSSTGPERYHVSMDIGFCSCPHGISGQRCKHQVAVEKMFELQDTFPHTSMITMRKLYHEIATGGMDFPEDWFQSLLLRLSYEDTAGISCSGPTPSALDPVEIQPPHSHALPEGISCGGDAHTEFCEDIPPDDTYSAHYADTSVLEDELARVTHTHAEG
uniref:uncharacterized protein LOC117256028 n=1 Tax=Epinephelus lanceolatus TaxID=310571 RepID=UPI0014452A52|nr:uncharacterized protein LOC117256028 [Epinephelus lanceolatus]